MGHQKASDDVITVINVNSRLLTSIQEKNLIIRNQRILGEFKKPL